MNAEEIKQENYTRIKQKFNIPNKEELNARLSILPYKYRRVFEAKWGIDEKGKYCSRHIILAYQLHLPDSATAKAKLLEAEKAFNESKLLFDVFQNEVYSENTFWIAVRYAEIWQNIWPKYKHLVKEDIKGTFEQAQKCLDEMIILNTKKPYVFRERYGLDNGVKKTLKEVGQKYNSTPEGVRRITLRILRKMTSSNASKDVFIKNIIDKNTKFAKETPIGEMNLSARACNCLMRANITTFGELLQYSKKELKRIRGLGTIIFEEIRGLLRRQGYEIK